jgi:quercetin dioxygenase-like cupin family protein
MLGTEEIALGEDIPKDTRQQDAKRAELIGKVLNLKDLVQYQEGTIASRMIVNRKAGNITIFAFDVGEGLSEHTAPFDAVVTILDGECEVRVGGTPHAMKQGDSIIFPANIPHALSATSRFKMMLTMIRE